MSAFSISALALVATGLLGASLVQANEGAPVRFGSGASLWMVRYLERAKVPPSQASELQRVYSVESASCSPETHPSEYHGGGDVRSLVCRLYTPSSIYHDHTSYEGGLELISILSAVKGGGYTEFASAVDISCTVSRAQVASTWHYDCVAGNVSGVTDTSSDN